MKRKKIHIIWRDTKTKNDSNSGWNADPRFPLFQSNPDADLQTNFELNDTLYARASISPADAEEVYLWLGANVMLAYPLGEAETMLDEKLTAAQSSLKNCEEDLEFLREQITVRIPLLRI